jgi:catechol 2,3-dioxygenase-like lactoylglutathione lyase family enzyme
MQLAGVVETCLYVDDLPRAERFYSQVLGMDFVSRHEGRHVFFRCAQQMVLLFDAEQSNLPGEELPPHGTRGAGHVAFAAPLAMLSQWKTHLSRHDVPIELDFQWPHGGRSLYFRDPAGNSLEITTPTIWGLPEPAGQ